MGRRPQGNYVEAAKSVLTELGGGPLSSRALVDAAQERGLIGDGTWVYHNFLRKVRESNEFNTSVRGQISLTAGTLPVEAAPVAEVPAPELETVTLPGDDLGAEVETSKF